MGGVWGCMCVYEGVREVVRCGCVCVGSVWGGGQIKGCRKEQTVGWTGEKKVCLTSQKLESIISCCPHPLLISLSNLLTGGSSSPPCLPSTQSLSVCLSVSLSLSLSAENDEKEVSTTFEDF